MKKRPNSQIYLKNCHHHNLKHLSLSFPKHQITVITGVSGSGKSSLAFDTLFAEGQRRYLEYLSPQTRTWIKQMPKPAVDFIEGLSPTLAVGQGGAGLSHFGTVATYTDIYDFLSLLFATIGEQHSPSTGKRLIRHSRQEIVELLLKKHSFGEKIQILSPVKLNRETLEEAINRLQNMGFIRLRIGGVEWTEGISLPTNEIHSQIDVVVDRLEIKENIRDRLGTSVETALDLGQGALKVQEGRDGPITYLTEIFVCPETSVSFAPLTPSNFNFNSIHGACPLCKGTGGQQEINPNLIFDKQEAPLSEQIQTILDKIPKQVALTFRSWLQLFFKHYKIDEEKPFKNIPASTLKKFLNGSADLFELRTVSQNQTQIIQSSWQGLLPFLNRLLEEKKSAGRLKELDCVEWRSCPSCKGARLKPESLVCLLKGKNIAEICELTISSLLIELKQWNFNENHHLIAQEILPQIIKRLEFLSQVGLGYLELNRQGRTLSQGESNRIQLASQIGAKLSGLIYILDEPSLGLHPKDMDHLQEVINELKDLGNTIVMVEHEKRLIIQADHVVELGPGAGKHGGEITFEGSVNDLLNNKNSLTGLWLSGKKQFAKPPKRKPIVNSLHVKNVSLHNLHKFSVDIPLGRLVGFCGVSGSGKSTLAIDIIGSELRKKFSHRLPTPSLTGHDSLKRIILGEKTSERFSSRSIPATYIGLMTPLRQLYATTRLAKARGYTASRFSLNKKGGRCEACEGLGELQINMQLMPDLFVPCDVCMGERYNYETLQVKWGNYNIAEALALSVEESLEVFRPIPTLAPTLEMMQKLGLGYMTLNQSFQTLSGGEIQRLKLVSELSSKSLEPTLYILDEPSAGLHFEDLQKLILIFHELVDQGHSVLMIEHDLDLLMQAHWLIELGPEGGPGGGQLIFEGKPEKLARSKTPTGSAIALQKSFKK